MQIRYLAVSVVFAVACSDKNVGSTDGCGDNAACEAGEICINDECRQLCRSDGDCDEGICVEDVCTEGTRTDGPVIESIDADGTEDTTDGHVAHHIVTKLTITGENFEGAGVTLSNGSNDWELELCSTSATELVVELPDGIVEGTYSLTVVSQGGECTSTLPVLQGETGPQGPTGADGAPGVPCAGCVDTDTLAGDAVTSAKILDGEVSANDLDDDSVDSGKIVDGSIAAADLSDMGCAEGQRLRRTASGWECFGGERCYTVSINNRNGTAWKYARFHMPFECHPPFMDAGYPNTPPTSFGCRVEMWVEHHSGNGSGYWRGQRAGNMAIWPDGHNSGNAYMQFWDWSGAGLYDIESGPGETLLGSHWDDLCRFTDSYNNGSAWAQASPHANGGWPDMGIMANVYTRCTLRFCEGAFDIGTYEIAERTSGPLDDE